MLSRRFADLDIQELLGIGGAAEVYRAVDRRHGEVAVKVLSANAEPDMVARFLREGRTMSALHHPHIVRVHRIGEQDGTRYIVMELAAGGSLRDLLIRERLPWRRAVQIALQLTEALGYAHEQGIYHRDVKPGNVMFAANDACKLMDFGLAHVIDAPSMTRTGTVMGTVLYLSPEQAVGQHVDGRSDLYSLGAMLYEMITGEPPFSGPSAVSVVYKHLNHEAPRLRDQVDVPPQLDAIVARLLKKDASRRYQSAADLAVALGILLQDDAQAIATLAPEPEQEQPQQPFVGRKAELETLTTALERAASGLGGCIMLAGEAGIGKSRLVSELSLGSRDQNFATLQAACLYADAPSPYGPIVEIIEAISARQPVQRDSADPLEGEIADSLGAARRALGLDESSTPAGQASPGSQAQTFELLTHLLATLSRRRPLLLVLDDLHWASPTLLQLLHHLARGLQSSRVLMVGAYRPEDLVQDREGQAHPLTETLRRMSREGLYEPLALSPLPLSDTGLLLWESLGGDGVSDQLVDLVHGESEGNPLYTLETLHLLEEEGGLEQQNERWVLGADIEMTSMPQTLTDLVMRRVDRVTPTDRELLDWSAILGQRPDAAILSSLTASSRLALLRHLARLERDHHLLVSDESGYAFAHGKIRQALYEAMPIPLRKECHLLAAQAIEDLSAGPTEPLRAYQLAHHYIAAGSRAKGYQYALQAAQQAEETYALAEACSLYHQALNLLTSQGEPVVPEDAQPAEELRLRARHGRLLLTTGDLAGSRDQLQRALGLARRLERTSEQADILLDLGVAGGRQGEWDTALSLADQSLRLALEMADDSRAASALLRSGFMAFEQGDWPDAIARLRHGIELAKRRGDRLLEARLVGNMAIVHHVRGELETAVQLHQANMAVLEELGSPMDVGRGYSNLGFAQQKLGDLDSAQAAFRSALEAFQRVSEVREQGVTYLHLAEVALLREDLALAREHCGRAIDRFERVGFELGIADVHRVFAGIARHESRWRVAERYLQEALATYAAAGDDLNVAETEEELGHLMQEMGQGAKAREALERSRTMFDLLRGEGDDQDQDSPGG